MDLGSCPKCAAVWIRGDERCRQCGYIAIGAVLSRLPKKKKKKVKKYVEPGGATPMLSFTLVAILAWGGYYYRPWSDDWDLIRGLVGSGRHHSLKGDWQVVETLRVKDATDNIFSRVQVASGSMSFDGKDAIKLAITNDAGTATANGHYTVDGVNVAIFGLSPSSDSTTPIPKNLRFTVEWTGPDECLVFLSPDDTLKLRRKEGNDLSKLTHMALTKSVEDAPDSVKGLIATVQRSAGGGN